MLVSTRLRLRLNFTAFRVPSELVLFSFSSHDIRLLLTTTFQVLSRCVAYQSTLERSPHSGDALLRQHASVAQECKDCHCFALLDPGSYPSRDIGR